MDLIVVSVAQVGDVADGEMKPIDVSGRSMILANVAGTYRVFARECPHEWVDLTEGYLDGGTVVCAQHGYEFDVETGECVTSYVWCSALATLPTTLRDGEVCVELKLPT